jgi:hypothetical protein
MNTGPRRSQKNPRLPARVPFGLRWSDRLAALVPPRSSVLPPGAGNKAEKAIQPKKRANNAEERYVREAGAVDRNLDAAAIARHDNGDAAAIPTLEQTQHRLQNEPDAGPARDVRAV